MKKLMSVFAAAAILATPFAVVSTAQAAGHTGAPMAAPAAAPAATPTVKKAPVKKVAKKSRKAKMIKKAV